MHAYTGTSDEHISIVQYLQATPQDGAVVVTTPQEVTVTTQQLVALSLGTLHVTVVLFMRSMATVLEHAINCTCNTRILFGVPHA